MRKEPRRYGNLRKQVGNDAWVASKSGRIRESRSGSHPKFGLGASGFKKSAKNEIGIVKHDPTFTRVGFVKEIACGGLATMLITDSVNNMRNITEYSKACTRSGKCRCCDQKILG
jgi:hypothetical protein